MNEYLKPSKSAIPSIYYQLLKVGGYHLSMPCHAGSCLCNASTRSWRRKRARTKRKEKNQSVSYERGVIEKNQEIAAISSSKMQKVSRRKVVKSKNQRSLARLRGGLPKTKLQKDPLIG